MKAQKAEVAARIKSARAEKGWKQKHLAAEVKVEPITVSRLERAATSPDFDALALIAEATGKPAAPRCGGWTAASRCCAPATRR